MKERHQRRFSLLSLPLREVHAIDRRSVFKRSELRSRREEWRGNGVKNLNRSKTMPPYLFDLFCIFKVIAQAGKGLNNRVGIIKTLGTIGKLFSRGILPWRLL